MDLSDFRTRAARVSGMSTSDTGDLALLDEWANDAVIKFLELTKVNQTRAVMAVTADEDTYTLDTDILSFEDLRWEPANGNQDVILCPVSSKEIERMNVYEGSVDVTTRYYAMLGANAFRLYPAPASSSDLLHITYVPRPSASMTAATHSPSDSTRGNIPAEYHDVLEAYVKWKACEAEDHKPSEYGLKFQSEWEMGCAKVRASMQRKSGVMKSPVRVGRRHHFPGVTPGTDLGY